MNILALDLATTSGIAFGDAGEGRPTTYYSTRFAKAGGGADLVGCAFLTWFADLTRVEKFDAVFIERAMHPAVAAKIGTTPETNMILVGLAFMAASFARARNIPRVEFVDAQKAKKHFAGQARFKDEFNPVDGRVMKSREVGKRATIIRCQQLGLQVTDDNTADAVSLWFYGASLVNPRLAHASSPLFAVN